MELNGKVLFKFTDFGGRDAGVKGRWSLPEFGSPGRWMPDAVGSFGRFGVGYRLTTLAGLAACAGRELYVAEGAGGGIYDGSMVVCRRARLVRRLDGWDGSAAEAISRASALRVAAYFSSYQRELGRLPMVMEEILAGGEARDWLGSARDDLRLCAGLIAVGASKLVIERCEEAVTAQVTVQNVRASAYKRAMDEERGRQLADILAMAWSPDVERCLLTSIDEPLEAAQELEGELYGESEIVRALLENRAAERT